ncbi:MAG: hypothetical protein ACQEUZ_01110 [Pseudomonadota bacterium]
MSRIFGTLLLVLAAAALWADYRSPGGVLKPASFAERWAEIHLDSLIGLQAGLENRLHPDAWLDYVLPVLELPAAPILAAAGVLLLALGPLWRRGAA